MKCSQDCPDLSGVAEVYDLTVPEKIISPHVVRQTGRGEGQPVVAEGHRKPLEAHVDHPGPEPGGGPKHLDQGHPIRTLEAVLLISRRALLLVFK